MICSGRGPVIHSLRMVSSRGSMVCAEDFFYPAGQGLSGLPVMKQAIDALGQPDPAGQGPVLPTPFHLNPPLRMDQAGLDFLEGTNLRVDPDR